MQITVKHRFYLSIDWAYKMFILLAAFWISNYWFIQISGLRIINYIYWIAYRLARVWYNMYIVDQVGSISDNKLCFCSVSSLIESNFQIIINEVVVPKMERKKWVRN